MFRYAVSPVESKLYTRYTRSPGVPDFWPSMGFVGMAVTAKGLLPLKMEAIGAWLIEGKITGVD